MAGIRSQNDRGRILDMNWKGFPQRKPSRMVNRGQSTYAENQQVKHGFGSAGETMKTGLGPAVYSNYGTN